jgi:hypothetical protein
MIRTLIAALLATFAFVAEAQQTTTANQGQGSASVTEWYMNAGARRKGETKEICVTNAAGGTYVPGTTLLHQPLASRKSIEIQNLGPNAVYCTIDGTAPLATGANGRKIGPEDNLNVWSLDIGPSIAVRCIAATAAQATPDCLAVSEVQ